MQTLREVTIGRDKDCDIYLDQRCKYASSHHGTIYRDGSQLMFKDTSTNGTLINNVNVKHRAIPIQRGDTIMIAGKYPINWNQIETFFPSTYMEVQEPVITNPTQESGEQPDTNKWSWGAFSLYPIWGFFNGCWWAFFASFVSFSILPSILFGIFGRRLAWDNGKWKNAAEFNSVQSSWDSWGLILFMISIAFVFIFFIIFLVALS